MDISVVGIDLAKNVFQVHGVTAAGEVVVRKALRRAQVLPFFSKLKPCLVGIEACGTSHYWARSIQQLGHEVRLMPPAYVKPYVKRGKTDAGDAEAICEAVTRPTMRFVPIKSEEQQSALTIHRARELMIRQRTQVINMMRGLLAEFGIEIRKGVTHALSIARQIVDEEGPQLPEIATKMMRLLCEQGLEIHDRLRDVDRELLELHKQNELAKRLATIPGVGTIGASALAATVVDPLQFASGRQFAAWLGLTPLQNSSGGKERLGRISKMGDKYIRRILVTGMTAIIRYARSKPERFDPWISALVGRKPGRLASVALANKAARIAWALMTRGGTYRLPRSADLVATA